MGLHMPGHYCAGKYPATNVYSSAFGVRMVFGIYIIWMKDVEHGSD